jgi:hypothetical protein
MSVVRGKWRRIRRLGLVLVGLVAAYAALLLYPKPLFASTAGDAGVLLHARQPLPPQAREILADVRRRVARSPFYDPAGTYDLFLCDDSRLFTAFTLWDRRAGGVSHWTLTGNIFLRPAHVENNRLLSPAGHEVPEERTLAYFMAHEITHTMVARRIGRVNYARLNHWQAEGYADYVGKAGAFDYARSLAAFQADELKLDPRRSGLYLRYQLLVQHLLEQRGMTPQSLLAGPIDAEPIERELRRLAKHRPS